MLNLKDFDSAAKRLNVKFVILFNMNRKQVITFDSESVSVIVYFRNVFHLTT